MKKKLALLLALVMILSLVPMAAFAAIDTSYSAAASYVVVDETSVKADGSDKATMTIVFRKGDGSVLNTQPVSFYVKSNRDAEEVKVADAGPALPVADVAGPPAVTGMSGKDGALVNATTDANGIVELAIRSSVSGEATISIYNGAVDADSALLVGKATITFTADASKVNAVTITADKGAYNAGEEIELKAKVVDSKSNGLANETVVFERQIGSGSFEKIGEVKTNVLGEAKLKVSYTKADNYTFKAKVGSKEGTVGPLAVAALDPMTIEVVTDKFVVAQDSVTAQDVTFLLRDSYGNKVNNFAKLTVEIKSAPDKSSKTVTQATVADVNSDKEISAKVLFDKVGDYVIRGKITGTGVFKELTMTAKEYGTAQSVKVELPKAKKSIKAVGPDSLTLVVNEIDENGIEKAAVAGDYVVSTSDVTIATVAGFTVTSTNNKDNVGVATITLRHKTKNFVASIDVPVVGDPVAIKATPAVTGKNAEVTLQYVDKNGKITYSGVADTYQVFKGEAVTITSQGSFDAATGKATLKLEAADFGKHTLTVVNGSGLAVTFDVDFGSKPVEKVVYGAKELVLTIGASIGVADGKVVTSDLAAFIKDGRTFVPVRFIAEQLGAEVSFTTNAEGRTETVTLTRPDLTVTITMGSSSIVVVKDGVSSTVTADVAAFVDAASGRTVLPFRALAEAMGANVSFGPEGGMVEWVKFAQ